MLDPQPGQVAIDCTFGDGGHAGMVAERLGPTGTLIAIDRDPLAEERFAELAAASTCAVRFIRSGYAEALEQLSEEGVQADMAYFDLGMSSMQVDTRERGFSYSYDAPLDMRMDPSQELTARMLIAEWDERRLAHALRDYRRGAPRGRDRPHDRANALAGADRDDPAARRRDQRRRSQPPRGSPAATPPSAPSRPCGSPSTTSSVSWSERCRSPGGSCARAACWPASPSTRWRTGASSASSPTVRVGASARPTCRSAPAGASHRRPCCPVAR